MALDSVLTNASRQSKARFAVYVGDLGADTGRFGPRGCWPTPTPNNAVLLGCFARSARHRGDLRRRPARPGHRVGGALGVSAAASAFREGNLIDG